ncbi:MAG TPA: DNA methyltransferase [Solirubrobacterales bacterium]
MFHPWSSRERTHGLFQYPAMMVPQMQRELLEELAAASDAKAVYDPFVGSGTTMAEAMAAGLDFVGCDINPLAVLLCRAKAGPFYIDALEKAAARVSERASSDRSKAIEVSWDGWKKWFRPDVAIALSQLKRAILAETVLSTRRFLWVALAETVRLCSNSRTSTVKLHIRPLEEREGRKLHVCSTFEQILTANLQRFDEQRQMLEEEGVLSHSHYRGRIAIHLHDISSAPRPVDVVDACEVLLTSPPYGDNATTVTYGQHAFLPLQWIELSDIDAKADERFLASTHAIDSMSLGAPTRGALEAVGALRAASPALDKTLADLGRAPRDRALRVAAFWRDLDTSLDRILESMSSGALMAWTVGNRRVGGLEVPMDQILAELLEQRGCEEVTVLRRSIPECRKRMAPRNAIAETMSAEQVLIFATPAEDG